MAKCVPVVHRIWFQCFLSLHSKTRLSLNVPLGSTVTFTSLIAYILGNYRHARRQGGCQPAAVKPPLYVWNYFDIRFIEAVPSLLSAKTKRDAQGVYGGLITFDTMFRKSDKSIKKTHHHSSKTSIPVHRYQLPNDV